MSEEPRAAACRRWLELLLSQLPAAVWAVDRELRFTAAAGAAFQRLGLDAARVPGLALTECFQTDDTELPIAAHRQALEGAVQDYELEWRGGWFAVHVEPLRDAEGAVVGVIGIAQDVTEARRARSERAALLDLVAELDQATRTKAEFVASMSHELRTPLNVIIGYSDLLVDQMFGELSVEQRETVRRIGEQGRELLELVTTTLDMSRLESGRVPLALQNVDLVALLGEIELEAQLVRRNAAVQVTWHVAPALPSLRTDPVKLKVIVKNLLLNALKFTDEGTVMVTAAPRDGGVEIAVADSGIGIAPDMLGRIFDPFRQGDHGGAGRGGVGLGLHIVRRLLEALGGSIAVESELRRGSTFRVWISSRPLRMADSAAAGSGAGVEETGAVNG